MKDFLFDLAAGVIGTIICLACLALLVFAIFSTLDLLFPRDESQKQLVCDGKVVVSGVHYTASSKGNSHTLDGSTYVQKSGELCKLYRVAK